MSIVPIVIGAFGKVTEGLLKGLEDFLIWQTSGDHRQDLTSDNPEVLMYIKKTASSFVR